MLGPKKGHSNYFRSLVLVFRVFKIESDTVVFSRSGNLLSSRVGFANLSDASLRNQ